MSSSGHDVPAGLARPRGRGGRIALALLQCVKSRLAQSGHERPLSLRCTGPDLLYLIGDPWPWVSPHEAAPVHHDAQWRAISVASHGRRAAGAHAFGSVMASRFSRLEQQGRHALTVLVRRTSRGCNGFRHVH